MAGSERGEVIWQPTEREIATSRLRAYWRWLEARKGPTFGSYNDAWSWSARNLDAFWSSIWSYFAILGSNSGPALGSDEMPGAVWFPGARINYAENALRHLGGEPAVIAWDEAGTVTVTSRDSLRDEVARLALGLETLGVRKGDRVAAYLPNVPEAVIALLACASIGAIWTCCPPDYGVDAVLDRFRQVNPRVLLTVDGYRYRGRDYDRRSVAAEVRRNLKDLTATVWLSRLGYEAPPWSVPWNQLRAQSRPLIFNELPFDHPLWILYSSGTTGLPKPIVHSHGGIVLEHMKSLGLQVDLREGTRSFQYASTGWVMWNILVGGLMLGATIVLYDGAADFPDQMELWRKASDLGIEAFGTSPAFLERCRALGLKPGHEVDLTKLKTISSTGAPLTSALSRWLMAAVDARVFLRSTSGGTDVCTSLLGCAPILPVRAGEIQCRPLGVAVTAFDQAGHELVGEPGELVVTRPMPSMPVGFWNDSDHRRYRATYFDRYPGVWRHGDWVTVYEDGSSVVHGRSDATLKRGGVRIGTAEIYRSIERVEGIVDSVAVDIEVANGKSRVLLLVVLEPTITFDEELKEGLKERIRGDLSPRHVPDLILPVTVLPRTLNGKRLEVPIKRVLMGASAIDVVDPGSVTDYVAFEQIVGLRELVAGSEAS